jgi:hypothetical protein
VLASYHQQNLKYVRLGQPAEIALDPYPGQIFKGKVEGIWMVNAQGQYLPSDALPSFNSEDPHMAKGLFAVMFRFDDRDQARFSIGAHGQAANYTSCGGFAALRRITIRMYSWFNWLYPIPD